MTHPFGKNEFTSTLRLYRDVRRLDITTEIVNREAFVRYRVLFPTTITTERMIRKFRSAPSSASRRRSFPPKIGWTYSNDHHGLAVLNRGLPGNNVTQNVMMLSLARSSRLISYGYIGGYEPGVSSDSGS